jgi:hypothetical protein
MDIQRSSRLLVAAASAAIVLFATSVVIRAQAPRIRYVSGTNVQPAFEGWEKKKDGTYDLWFSYLNRNLGEDISVPIGKENDIEPGGPDRGQPTYFYSGRREFVFKLNVPKEFGNNQLTWTLTVRGDTLKAVGSLLPVWEINTALIVSRTVPQARLDTLDQNKAPSLALDQVAPATLAGGAMLRATVTDDGVPGPKPVRPQRQGGEAAVFLNAPLPPPPPAAPNSLSLMWIQYRGPGKVTFEPSGYAPVKSGEKATTTAKFSEPGTYELRAIAHDSILFTMQNVTVTVK